MTYGYCAAKSQYYWGMRLVLLTDWRGLPTGYTLVPANEREYEPVRTLAVADGSPLLVADKGLWGAEYAETLRLEGITIRTPDRAPHGRKPDERALPGLVSPGDRVDDRQPEVPDAPRATSGQDPGRLAGAHRLAAAGAHARHVPQRPARASAAQPGSLGGR